MMEKIILVLTNNIGGLHSFRKEVIKAIVEAGYNVYISEPDNDERVNYFKEIGCNIIKTSFNRRGINPFADLNLLRRYYKYIKKLKPIAVLTYTIKPNIYGGVASRLCKVPQLANITGLGDSIENGGLLSKIAVALYRIGLSKTKLVFFQNSNDLERCIHYGIANKNSILLPGSGVNLSHHIFQPYPPKEEPITFLFIGRLLKDKGTEEFFSTAQIIKKKYPNTIFQILGKCESSYQHQLDHLIKDGIIEYLGTTTDVRPYIGNAHCTIMPSYHEGMSNVNLESAANGRPVITTNVPGCRETVDNGITGYLVNPRSAKSLIEKVEQFILLPYEKKYEMGHAARQKVESEFDRNIVVNAYMEQINKL